MTITEIDRLFGYRNNLVLLGITGYTSAGSKSLATILRNETNPFELPNAAHIYTDNYFSNRKLSIAERFHEKSNWQPFRVIKVSHIILVISFFMDDKTLNHAFNWVADFNKSNPADIKKHFTKAKKSFFNEKEKVSKTISNLINIESKLFSGDIELSYVVDFIQEVRSLNSDLSALSQLFDAISSIKNLLATNLNETAGTYTLLFQYLGFLIRRGEANHQAVTLNIGSNKIETHYHLIPSVIYKVVNIYRIMDEATNQSTRIVIESLRNHHEIHYLRSRFPNFYLLAVHRNDEERKRSIKDKYKDVAEFVNGYETGKLTIKNDKIDEDRAKELKQTYWFDETQKVEAEEFWLSDISKCIQLGDIHLFNARHSDTYNDLRAQLCWYLSLILHPGLFTPTDHERVMNLAFQAKLNSGCISRQVGAAVTDGDFKVLSIGWNDVPAKQTPCILRSVEGCLTCSTQDDDYSKYEKKSIYEDSFKQYLATNFFQPTAEGKIIEYDADKKPSPIVSWDSPVPLNYCFKDVQNKWKKSDNQVHTRAVHAEENAMLQVGYLGLPKNSNLFTTASTCELCAKKASELGITSIYYVDPYPGLATTHNLQYTTSPKLKQFFGAVGMGFYRLYMPLLPMKEELALRGARARIK